MTSAELPRLFARTEAIEEPAGLVEHLDNDGLAWINDRGGLVASGTAWRGAPALSEAPALWDELASRGEVDDDVRAAGTGLVAFGSFAFEAGGSSALVVPREVIGRDGDQWFVTSISADAMPHAAVGPGFVGPAPPPQADRPRYAGTSVSDVAWLVGVAAAVEAVASGGARKVVLARDHRLWAKQPFQRRGVAHRLVEHFPHCFTFIVDGLVGATPELLVRRTADHVSSLVLAGSAARSPDPLEDERAGRALLASDKDAQEHDLAAESVDEVLRPRCSELSRSEPRLLRLENVQHVATDFEGRLHSTESALALAAALHPTAAVGGTPRGAAIGLIHDLEDMDRGRYAGPVGWVDDNGDGEFGIALRCAQIDGDRARLFAGAGIVAGSLPEAELEETRIKLRAMQAVLGDD